MIEVRHVQAFVALARHLHFGRAAEEVRISQPAVSTHLQQIERGLRVKLFNRTSRTVGLTRAGEIYLPYAEQVLETLTRGKQAVSAYTTGLMSTLRVGFVQPVARDMLNLLVGAHGLLHPSVSILLCEVSTADHLDTLRSGDVDIIISVPAYEEIDGIESVVLRDVPVFALIAKAHAYAAKPEIDWSEFASIPFVAGSPRDVDRFKAACRASGLHSPELILSADGFHAAVARVSLGHGVTVLPGLGEFSYPGVAVVPVTGVTMEESIFWRERDEERGLVRDFIVTAGKVARDLVAARPGVHSS